eukprot:TRINITY_DN19959_c0_g1_i1.p1 TRINITY_DN19959_c0_g1~~TRINITY_DN19959_c0_g1_i1.p1  ORF type:complete len:372 (-),score=32.13 TRINITY_DN19959_c0_g1_i1:5-1120(-)
MSARALVRQVVLFGGSGDAYLVLRLGDCTHQTPSISEGSGGAFVFPAVAEGAELFISVFRREHGLPEFMGGTIVECPTNGDVYRNLLLGGRVIGRVTLQVTVDAAGVEPAAATPHTVSVPNSPDGSNSPASSLGPPSPVLCLDAITPVVSPGSPGMCPRARAATGVQATRTLTTGRAHSPPRRCLLPSFRRCRLRVWEVRAWDEGWHMQLPELVLYDPTGHAIDLRDTSITCSSAAYSLKKPTAFSAGSTTATFRCSGIEVFPVDLCIDLPRDVCISAYAWRTSVGSPLHDPVSWEFQAELRDHEWCTLDQRERCVPASRGVVIGPFELSPSPVQTGKEQTWRRSPSPVRARGAFTFFHSPPPRCRSPVLY